MPLTRSIKITACNNFNSAEQIIHEAEMQGIHPEARDVVRDKLDNIGIEQMDVAATEEKKQNVLQTQLLVLGDARTGKTTTIKALTGKKFKDDEKKTKGVRFRYVNREWKTLELEDMKFGSFDRFFENIEMENVSWPEIHNDPHWYLRIVSYVLSMRNLDSQDAVDENLKAFLPRLALVGHAVVYYIFNFIHNSIFEDFLVKGLLCLIANLITRASYRNGIFVSLLVLLLLHVSHLGMIGNLWTGACLMEVLNGTRSSNPNETIAFGRVFQKCFLYPLESLILALFYLLCLMVYLLILHTFFKNYKEKELFLSNILYENEIPLHLFIFCELTLFAPFSFFSYYTTPASGYFNLILHLFLLHKQKMLLVWYTGPALVLELAIIYQLCVIGLNSEVQIILLKVILLCIEGALHFFGIYHILMVNGVSKVESSDRYPLFYDIEIQKHSLNVENLKAALDQNFCKLKIKILDFAGDEDYYAYHHIFLNSNAIYVVVFNIQECIKDNFKDIKSKIRRIRFWLESIHSHVPQCTSIFLVGTHRGDINMDTLSVINTYLYDALGHSFIKETVRNEKDDLMFFHVENSRGLNDNGVIGLRKKIRSVAEDELKNVICQEIPLSWIKVQDATIRYQESRQTPVCLTIDKFKEVTNHLYVKWSEEMLKYFHEKGLIIYLDKNKNEGLSAEAQKNEGLSKWVLLNPRVLLRVVILLISPPEEFTKEKHLKIPWILLKKSGMITKDLLNFIISHAFGDEETKDSSLITFLEEYDLICPLKDPFCDIQHLPEIKQVTHLVPSLLPAAPDPQSIWPESSEDVKFYIFFDRYVPDAFFFRLLSRSCKVSYNQIECYEPQIYRDCGVFWYSQQIYRLRIMKDEGLIEVTLTKSTGVLEPYDILLAIAARVEDIRNRDFHNLFFHCGPGCSSPFCPGSCTDSTSWLTDQPRRHVYNIYPACKQKGPKCFKDFFKCQNVFRGEDAKIWMPSPTNRGPIERLR